jgi:hypothetical protein
MNSGDQAPRAPRRENNAATGRGRGRMGWGGLGWGGERDGGRGRAGRSGPGVSPDGGLGHGSEGSLLEYRNRSSTEAKLTEVSPVKNGTQSSPP